MLQELNFKTLKALENTEYYDFLKDKVILKISNKKGVDVQSNVAFKLAKRLNRKPMNVAIDIKNILKKAMIEER